MKLTEHFTLAEFTRSITALQEKIDNTPPDDVLEALKLTAEGMERIRTALGGRTIKITSAFRCKALNAAVKGVATSQHVKGEAVDFVCPEFGTPKEIVAALAEGLEELGIDQIIAEGTWVHVSFSKTPRYAVLEKTKTGFRKGLS